jgi:hypothetical protein
MQGKKNRVRFYIRGDGECGRLYLHSLKNKGKNKLISYLA